MVTQAIEVHCANCGALNFFDKEYLSQKGKVIPNPDLEALKGEIQSESTPLQEAQRNIREAKKTIKEVREKIQEAKVAKFEKKCSEVFDLRELITESEMWADFYRAKSEQQNSKELTKRGLTALAAWFIGFLVVILRPHEISQVVVGCAALVLAIVLMRTSKSKVLIYAGLSQKWYAFQAECLLQLLEFYSGSEINIQKVFHARDEIKLERRTAFEKKEIPEILNEELRKYQRLADSKWMRKLKTFEVSP